uniref:Uncharacterized protein n=1 Tax=Tanacetum cinerariifolium TaxID=118510 RepID=A0A6L2NWA6_TANCI|nr:hypothetical protein [Tanacetum cinerariifolium]
MIEFRMKINFSKECGGIHGDVGGEEYERELLEIGEEGVVLVGGGECGANLKKLNDLLNGIRALLNGFTKLEKLSIHLLPGGLTDLGCGTCRVIKRVPEIAKVGNERSGCDFSQQALVTFVLNETSLRYLWVEEYHAFQSGHDLFGMVRPFWKMELIKSNEFDYGPEGPSQHKPPSLLAYYSLVEQRNDFPKSVIPLT